jgi:hypothetical protein
MNEEILNKMNKLNEDYARKALEIVETDDEFGEQVCKTIDDLIPVTYNIPYWLFQSMDELYQNQPEGRNESKNDILLNMCDAAMSLYGMVEKYPEVAEAYDEYVKEIHERYDKKQEIKDE